MRTLAALALLCCSAIVGACATSAVSEHNSACAALAAFVSRPATTRSTPLSSADVARLREIATSPIEDNGYQCGSDTYREARPWGSVFFDIGVSRDQRFASIGEGTATFGQRWLLRRRGDEWIVVGSTILWIA